MNLNEVFCKLDFDKIESVGGVAFSEDVRGAIQHLLYKYANSEWYARTSTSPNKRILMLQREAQDCRRYVKSLRANLDNFRSRLPIPWHPLSPYGESMISINDLCDKGNNMAEVLEDIAETLPRRKAGRPRNDFERELIRGIFKEAGCKSTAYPSRSREGLQDYKGQLLDLVEEILVQTGYPYHSRNALAKLIIAQRLRSSFAPVKNRRQK